MADKPKGILRNAKVHDYSHLEHSEYDRKQVLENTKRNAELFKERSEKIKQEVAKKASENAANVQFNKKNLEENDKLKAEMEFTKIDEPKTPYQGTIDENSEYYRDDEDSIPDFTLGEGEDEEEGPVQGSLKGSQIVPSAEEDMTEEELKHKRFEEMRKKHYHHEVFKPLVYDDEEEEEEEEENDLK